MSIRDLEHLEVVAEETRIVGSGLVEVIPGDSVTYLSELFCGDASWADDIVAANGLSNPDLIYPGQVLEVPCF